MTGMYKAMEDCVGLGVDETLDAEQVIISYKRWTIILAYPFQIDLDWYLSPLEVCILNFNFLLSGLRMASLRGVSRDADEVR